MKHSIIITILFVTFSAFGQIAVIEDKDGFTNVRLEPNPNSKIIYQIKVGEVFWHDEDYFDKSKDWTRVYFPKNKFSLSGRLR